MNKITKLLMLLTAALLLISACGCTGGNSAKTWKVPPEMQIDTSKTYTAAFDTSFGRFEIELFVREAPITVNNFVFLARQGYYDNTVFHRITKDHVIQGGGPGLGYPGYSFADELQVIRPYDPGIVAMANSGPNTNGSQFFVCAGYRALGLNSTPNYTQFGRVISGMDVVLQINAVPTVLGQNGEKSLPINPPKINKVTIFEF